ncbi:MAG: dihydrodipicolinate synthase family protein [Candidatus Njordarchaeales archaeon]
MFHGVIVPMITPFKKDYSIDFEALKWLTEFLMRKGVHGLFPYSTTGEFVHLKPGEGIKIVETVLEEAKNSVKIIPGISSNTTLECIELGKKMEDLGVDGVIATPPFFFKLKTKHLIEHFSGIASRLSLPIIVYNIPSLTGNPIPVEVYEKLAKEHSNIAGAKITYDSVSYLRNLIIALKEVRKDFSILTGLDDMFLYTLLIGGDGGIMACANFAPQIHVELYNAYRNGEYEKAIGLSRKLAKLARIYDYASSFPSAIKTAFKILGTPVKPVVRPPLTPEPSEVEEKIRMILTELGLVGSSY